LLDQLVQKSSNGQVKLGPEPDPTDKLPRKPMQAKPMTPISSTSC